MRERRLRHKFEGLDRHHVTPQSRDGGHWDNIVILPVEYHRNWHKLFCNMTVEEIHQFIDELMKPDTAWTYKDIDQLRQRIMRGDV